MSSILEINNLTKIFNKPDKTPLTIIENLSLEINENEFVCILGPSGSGKSTLLRMISGLETPTTGSINYKGKQYLKSGKEIGFVFQDYSLLPWRNVKDNIALGLEICHTSQTEKKKLVQKYLELIGLTKFANAKPYELSGGMQQRVAIARSLVNNPDILLMDEPFGALDAFTRLMLQKELLNIWMSERKTILFVTHSVDEAVFLADKIILMSNQKGKIKEIISVNIHRKRDPSSIQFNKMSKYILDQYESLAKYN